MRRINITADGLTVSAELHRMTTDDPALYEMTVTASNRVTATAQIRGDITDIRDVLHPLASLLDTIAERI